MKFLYMLMKMRTFISNMHVHKIITKYICLPRSYLLARPFSVTSTREMASYVAQNRFYRDRVIDSDWLTASRVIVEVSAVAQPVLTSYLHPIS